MPRIVNLNVSPTSPQYDFLTSETMATIFMGGIGSGKSYIAIAKMTQLALQYSGITIIAAANSFSQVRDVLIKSFIEFTPDTLYILNKSSYEVKFTNGSNILFRSLDSAALPKLRGINCAAFFIDEAAYTSEESFKVLLGRLRQPRFPHSYYMTTTPRASSWFNTHVQNVDMNETTVIRAATTSNKYLDPDFIKNLKAQYGENSNYYRQEILGELVENDGRIYPNIRICESITGIENYIYSVDWGFTHRSAIVVCGIDSSNTTYVLDEWAHSHVTDSDIGAKILEFYKTYGGGPVYCDSALPGSIETLKRMGIDAKKSNKAVTDGIRSVTNAFETGHLFILDSCTELLTELHNYVWMDDGESPVKKNDDIVDALRYAIHTNNTKGSDVSRFKNMRIR